MSSKFSFKYTGTYSEICGQGSCLILFTYSMKSKIVPLFWWPYVLYQTITYYTLWPYISLKLESWIRNLGEEKYQYVRGADPWEVRGHCMCKEMPVIPVNKVEDTKRIIKMEGWGGGEAQGVADPKRGRRSSYLMHKNTFERKECTNIAGNMDSSKVKILNSFSLKLRNRLPGVSRWSTSDSLASLIGFNWLMSRRSKALHNGRIN
jgi:hypothetical protein